MTVDLFARLAQTSDHQETNMQAPQLQKTK
jgi:hypothetical protein